jgi:hypothetical protein
MKVYFAGTKHVLRTFTAQVQNLYDSEWDTLWDHVLRVLMRYWGNYWNVITVDDSLKRLKSRIDILDPNVTRIAQSIIDLACSPFASDSFPSDEWPSSGLLRKFFITKLRNNSRL